MQHKASLETLRNGYVMAFIMATTPNPLQGYPHCLFPLLSPYPSHLCKLSHFHTSTADTKNAFCFATGLREQSHGFVQVPSSTVHREGIGDTVQHSRRDEDGIGRSAQPPQFEIWVLFCAARYKRSPSCPKDTVIKDPHLSTSYEQRPIYFIPSSQSTGICPHISAKFEPNFWCNETSEDNIHEGEEQSKEGLRCEQ